MSLAQKPETTYQITSKDIDLISFSHPASPPSGKNVAITFHATNAVLPQLQSKKKTLPAHITVGVNNKSLDAFDLTGDGAYTVFGHVAKQEHIPSRPIFLNPVNHKGKTEHLVDINIGTVPCPQGCTSDIFGTACCICIEISVHIHW
jgi:hypothetical protein